MVQLSLTLPFRKEVAGLAAERLILGLGFERAMVADLRRLDDELTFVIAYGEGLKIDLDLASLELEATTSLAGLDGTTTAADVDAFLRGRADEPLRIVAGAIGTEIHSLGLSAITNIKGYNGSPGLEWYRNVVVRDLGIQVDPFVLVREAMNWRAGVLLASVTVSHAGLHVANLQQLMEVSRAMGVRENLIMIAGGAAIDQRQAVALGYDYGFGKGATAADVMAAIAGHLRAEAGATEPGIGHRGSHDSGSRARG